MAISQRHPSKYYPHLQLPPDQNIHPLANIISAFFQSYVQHKFFQGKIHRYVVDLYIDSQERAWIIDFNVWGRRTDALLFDWTELTALGAKVSNLKCSTHCQNGEDAKIPIPEVRVVTKDMKSMTYDPLSSFRGPTDVMDLFSGGSGNANGISQEGMPSFDEFMKQCVKPSEL